MHELFGRTETWENKTFCRNLLFPNGTEKTDVFENKNNLNLET